MRVACWRCWSGSPVTGFLIDSMASRPKRPKDKRKGGGGLSVSRNSSKKWYRVELHLIYSQLSSRVLQNVQSKNHRNVFSDVLRLVVVVI